MSATDKPAARSSRDRRDRSLSPTHERASSRDRSHRRHHHHHHRTHKRARSRSPPRPVLPLNASPISMRHFDALAPVFAAYLDVQKNLILDELETREAKGRFKSFVSH